MWKIFWRCWRIIWLTKGCCWCWSRCWYKVCVSMWRWRMRRCIRKCRWCLRWPISCRIFTCFNPWKCCESCIEKKQVKYSYKNTFFSALINSTYMSIRKVGNILRLLNSIHLDNDTKYYDVYYYDYYLMTMTMNRMYPYEICFWFFFFGLIKWTIIVMMTMMILKGFIFIFDRSTKYSSFFLLAHISCLW